MILSVFENSKDLFVSAQALDASVIKQSSVYYFDINITYVWKVFSVVIGRKGPLRVIWIHAETTNQSQSALLTMPARRFVNIVNRPGWVITYSRALLAESRSKFCLFSCRLLFQLRLQTSEFVPFQSGVKVYQASKYWCFEDVPRECIHGYFLWNNFNSVLNLNLFFFPDRRKVTWRHRAVTKDWNKQNIKVCAYIPSRNILFCESGYKSF